MRIRKKIDPVLLISGILYVDDTLCEQAEKLLQKKLGKFKLIFVLRGKSGQIAAITRKLAEIAQFYTFGGDFALIWYYLYTIGPIWGRRPPVGRGNRLGF